MFWRVIKIERHLNSMLRVNVALPNGHAELLTLLPSSTVHDVRTKAQQAFRKKYLKLITAKNRVLVDFEQALEEAEIEDGECLTALVLQTQLAATESAFASWCHGDSAIFTWGDADFGGDSSAMHQKRSHSVLVYCPVSWLGGNHPMAVTVRQFQQIQAAGGVFAAILEDGSVVTWGSPDVAGDRWAIRDQLKDVQRIQATDSAFAAILEDGSNVTWGNPCFGGDSSAVPDQLKGVQKIQATNAAFAAILEDGSVVTWGRAASGGDSSEFEISSRVCSRFRPQTRPFLRFWKMDPWLPGVMQDLAVTVRQFEISWALFSQVQLCVPKWHASWEVIPRNRTCWSFCSAVTPSGLGWWKKWKCKTLTSVTFWSRLGAWFFGCFQLLSSISSVKTATFGAGNFSETAFVYLLK